MLRLWLEPQPQNSIECDKFLGHKWHPCRKSIVIIIPSSATVNTIYGHILCMPIYI